jgi:hypothetical protein
VTVERLRSEWLAERRVAGRITWALRLSAIGFAVAYLVTVTVFRRLDPFYLLLTVGTLVSGASQFVYLERYRVPAFVTRLAATPEAPVDAADSAERAAAEVLWPEVRAVAGRDLAAFAPRLLNAEEIAELHLATVVGYVRAAERGDWAARTRLYTPALVVVLAGIAAAALLRSAAAS